MIRAVYRFVDVTMKPDLEPDAEPIMHSMQCAVCGERSGAYEYVKPAQDWALKHTGETREHFTYREVITRPWRAVPADGLLP